MSEGRQKFPEQENTGMGEGIKKHGRLGHSFLTLALMTMEWDHSLSWGQSCALQGDQRHSWTQPATCQFSLPQIVTTKNVSQHCQMSSDDKITLNYELLI